MAADQVDKELAAALAALERHQRFLSELEARRRDRATEVEARKRRAGFRAIDGGGHRSKI
jgi:hypothetical protein